VAHREEPPVRVPVQHPGLVQVSPQPLRGPHDHDDAGPPLPQHPHQVLAILRIAARVQREQRGPHRPGDQSPRRDVPGDPGELQRKPRNSHKRRQLLPAAPGSQEQDQSQRPRHDPHWDEGGNHSHPAVHQLQFGDCVEQREPAAHGHEGPCEHESERTHDAAPPSRRNPPHWTILARERTPHDRGPPTSSSSQFAHERAHIIADVGISDSCLPKGVAIAGLSTTGEAGRTVPARKESMTSTTTRQHIGLTPSIRASDEKALSDPSLWDGVRIQAHVLAERA